jgi:hypothetical protein
MSKALAEAYAVAPTDSLIYDTLELRHPNFRDATGAVIAVRIVRDTQDLTATLEATAPMNPGETVTFTALMFDLVLPEESDNGVATDLTLRVDNVGKVITRHIDAAVLSTEPVEATYRPYERSDLTGPHLDPVLTMFIKSIKVNLQWIEATASFGNILNRRFPAQDFLPDHFKTLTAR